MLVLEPPLLVTAAATGASTILGGVIALQLAARLRTLAVFACGFMIGLVCFDLWPAAVSADPAAMTPPVVALLTSAGLIGGLVLNGAFGRGKGAATPMAPAGLVLHSTFDGFGIGLAAAVSAAAGYLITSAVVAHDLLDGANTVTLSLLSSNKRGRALAWLLADAVAPFIGMLLSTRVAPSHMLLGAALAVFAGFFLSIAVNELWSLRVTSARRPINMVTLILGTISAAVIALNTKS